MDKAPLQVILNTVEQGEYFVYLAANGDVLVPVDAFTAMGIRARVEPTTVAGESYVSLSSLAPGMSYQLLSAQSALSLQVDPAWLPKTSVDARHMRQSERELLAIDSAFLNYALAYYQTEARDYRSLEIPWEAVVNAHDVALASRFDYHATPEGQTLTRLTTSATHDDRQHLRRWVVGDFSAYSGELGGGGLFGGISVARKFSIEPYFVRYPGAEIRGLLETPSEVALYVNDILVRNEQLPAGEFEVLNLPALQGFGEATLVVKDAFGRERVSHIPFYSSSRLLKQGLHDYSYNLGFKRISHSLHEQDYGDLSLLARHRIGLTRAITAGMRAEAARSLVNAGPTATFLLGNFGEMDVTAAYSRDTRRQGYAAAFAYNFSSRRWHARMSLRHHSASYARVGMAADDDKPRLQGLAGLGVHGLFLGSLSLVYSGTEYHRADDSGSLALIYNTRLGKHASLLVRASKDMTARAAGTGEELFVSLNILLGGRSSASISDSRQDTATVTSAYMQKNVPVGTGFGYRLRLSETDLGVQPPRQTGDAYLQYNATHAVVSTNYTSVDGVAGYRGRIAGSLAFIDDRFFLSRPIPDSFALVEVGDLDDVRIYFSNQYVGRTRDGRLLVPGLTAYASNAIALEPRDIPVNVSLKEVRQSVSPVYRSGRVVAFPAKSLQAAVGRAYYREKGQRKSADFWRLQLETGDEPVDAVVGKQGEFYLENLPPGRYTGRLIRAGRSCPVRLTMPRSREMFVDVGEVVCGS